MNLLDRLDELIEKLKSEMLRLYNLEKKYSLTILGLENNQGKFSTEQIIQFQLKHNFKNKNENSLIYWNTEYKEEVLNETYIQVLDSNVRNIELLIPELRQQFEVCNSKKFNKFLTKKLKTLNNNIKNHDGYLFFDSDYRQRRNNLLKNRFDVIWNINEQFLLFPLQKRKGDNTIVSSADYPFVWFDIDQWCELELSYHLTPIFKEALGLEQESSNNNMLNETELQNIYNEYKHIFNSFHAFKYTYKTINNFKENISSEIESLYEFLFKKSLIVNRKTKFIIYLLKVHQIEQSKIRDYTNIINDRHSDRVEFHKKEWTKFIKSY